VQIRKILELSLLYGFVQINHELTAMIIRFGRSLRYLLSVSDEVSKHVLSSLDAELTDLFYLTINEKIVLRFIGVKDTSPFALSTPSNADKVLIAGYLN